MSVDNTEARIVVLEEKVAYQERLLSELDDVIRTFTTRVEALEAETERLRGELANAGAVSGANEKPPHY